MSAVCRMMWFAMSLNCSEDVPASQGCRPRCVSRRPAVIRALPRNTERRSHYFAAVLPQQFDLLIHIDETRAVEPLERTAHWERGELPETYPSTL